MLPGVRETRLESQAIGEGMHHKISPLRQRGELDYRISVDSVMRFLIIQKRIRAIQFHTEFGTAMIATTTATVNESIRALRVLRFPSVFIGIHPFL